MVYKVDGGGSVTPRREEPVYKKPEVKPAVVNTPQTNAAVYTNRSDSNNQANVLRTRLNAQFAVAPARQTTPTITPQEAEIRADEIIRSNGGRDNLNTEGVGRDLAAVAKTNPADARAITEAMLGDRIDQDDKGKVRENDKDEIAQSFANNLNDAEIDTVARDSEGRALLERMQRHLLAGSVHGDETETAERIGRAVGKYQTFSEYNQGIDRLSELAMTTSYGAAFDPHSTPEEAAAALKSPNHPYDIQSDVQAFTDQLDAHKNDPAWLRGYYAALGSEKTAELIGNAATTSGYSTYLYGMSGSQDAADLYNRNMDIIGDSLETLRANGGLTQTDMNNLTNAMADNFNPSVALDMFGKASPQVQEMFVRAAAANGSDTLEAAGSYVLGQMGSYQQSQILESFSDDGLNNFIQGAMAGQTEAIDMSNYLATGIADKQVTMGGVQKLLETANHTTVYYHAHVAVPDFSPELQNRIFNAAVNGLNNSDAYDNFRDNAGFKDELSRLFIRNGSDILKQQAPDGAFADANFVTGMTKFFELTLFSPNGGELRDDLMQSVINTMGNVGDASKNPPLSQSQYEALHNGWSQQDHTEVMGGLLGMVWQAAENQKDFIQNDIMEDAARKKEMVGFFVGMAFSFLPGASDVIGKIAGEGASFLQQLPDKIIDFAWGQGSDQLENGAQDILLKLLKGSSNADALANVDMLTDKFRDIIVATNAALPNGEEGELNLRTAFQSAFSFYHELVEFN